MTERAEQVRTCTFIAYILVTIKKSKQQYNCPVEVTLDVLAGKWKAMILWLLRDGALRFGVLRRKIPAVSERMLSQQLREMEREGIVQRRVFAEVPPRVEYSLTAYGQTLRPITELMCQWGKAHLRRHEAQRAG